jgi:hypothetical protein
MATIAPPQTILAESREAFDRLIEDTAVEIDLPSGAAEQAYEKADWRLHLQICDVMGVTDGYERSDRLVWLHGDWWPNQTKHIAVDTTAFGPDQVKALRALLKGEFEDWRITVGIYRNFNSNEPEHIGGLCIYAERIIVQKEALPFVEWASPRLRGA